MMSKNVASMVRLPFLFIYTVLAGCMTMTYYQPPSANEGRVPPASIEGTDLPGYGCTFLVSIDGQDVDPRHSCVTAISILPGDHEMEFLFRDRVFFYDRDAKTMAMFNAVSGHVYKINAEYAYTHIRIFRLSKRGFRLWISDETEHLQVTETSVVEVPLGGGAFYVPTITF